MFSLSYSADGNKALLYSLATLDGSTGAGESASRGGVYLARRSLTGWQLSSLNAPASEFVGEIPVAVEAQEGETLWKQHRLDESASSLRLYTRTPDGIFHLIGPLAPPTGSEEEPSTTSDLSGLREDTPVAATSNYSHIVTFGTTDKDYWSFDLTHGNNGSLYEYSGLSNQEPILVGVEGAKASRTLISLCGTRLGGRGSTYNALSDDGETIIFTVFAGCGTPASNSIYARVGGSLLSHSVASTTNISADECTIQCSSKESGKNFEGASEDGSRIFFTSTQKLTNNAVDGIKSGDATTDIGCATAQGQGGCNLYEYNFHAKEGTRLTLIAGGEVLGVSGIAENGARVYFVSRKPIASSGENEFGAPPVEGAANLYVYNTITKATAFIATLSGGDEGDWSKNFGSRPVEVNGVNGQFLLWISSEDLTPDDTSHHSQLFEYDAETSEFVRISKGENGYAEDGNSITAGVETGPIESVNEELGNGTDFKSRTNRSNMSVDGKTIFFLTGGQLSPRAISAEDECRNLYVFHSDGPIADGHVGLVSDGRDTELYKGAFCGPQFEGMDETGANVLFTTADPLDPEDLDGGQRDIYDARIGGGYLIEKTVSCRSSNCEGNSTSAPSSLSLESLAQATAASQEPATSVAHSKITTTKIRGKGGNRLAKALRACKLQKSQMHRRICEKDAHKRYRNTDSISSRLHHARKGL